MLERLRNKNQGVSDIYNLVKRQCMRDPGKIRYMWKPVRHVFEVWPSSRLVRRVIKHIIWILWKNMTLRFPSLPGSLMRCLLRNHPCCHSSDSFQPRLIRNMFRHERSQKNPDGQGRRKLPKLRYANSPLPLYTPGHGGVTQRSAPLPTSQSCSSATKHRHLGVKLMHSRRLG